jgi:nucleotide-binding universal stress UspA family protein
MSADCIAVATDFSPRTDRAIDRAKLLREQMGARLCVIHATNQAEDDPPDMTELNRQMRASTGLREEAGTIEFLYPSGSPLEAIVDTCENQNAALLVVGPARYNSIGDYFLGTAVDHILRQSDRPVLVAKNRVHSPYGSIIAGTDFSQGSAHAIAKAARLFPDASVHVVHAWQVPFQAFNKDAHVAGQTESGEQAEMDAFMEQLAQLEPRLGAATSELVRGDLVTAMRKCTDDNPDALVVVGSHGESGFKQATIGSVTSDLLRYLDEDTLVVSTKDAE